MVKAKRAARLCKADLTTGVVGEFPELQGVMGRYYALHDGEDAEVADAIRDHYKPVGPSDAVPTAPVSIAVALADKFDHARRIFCGRRTNRPDRATRMRCVGQALGIIRTVLENRLNVGLLTLASDAFLEHTRTSRILSLALKCLEDRSSC